MGRLVLVDYASGPDLTDSAVALYIAAIAQVKALDSKVIKPFEQAFKDNAEVDPNRSTFDNKAYGRLMVQVKTVPCQDVDYGTVREAVQERLEEWADLQRGTVDRVTTFFNEDLNAPRPYVAIDKILNYVQDTKIGEPRQRQEVNVLYLPEKATVLTV